MNHSEFETNNNFQNESTPMHISELDTPSLLLDLDQMEKNIEEIVSFAKQVGVNYRPHIKTHKSIEIAKRQIAMGAVGVTVATVGEAEVMAEAGINDILIAFPISGKQKLERVKELLKKSQITIAVDSIEQALDLNQFFQDESLRPNVWIKVNCGLNRAGVEPDEEVVELATFMKENTSALTLTGIFTHAGHAYGASSKGEIAEIAKDEADAVVKSVTLCEKAGINIKHRSIGSTPTFKLGGAVEGITEIRPGNAVFYDMVQVGLGVAKKEQCALTVLAGVFSKKKDRIIIDAGSKTLALDKGAHGIASVVGHGYIKEYPELIIERLSEEHGVIPIKEEIDMKLNEKLTIIPNHACVVANLFDRYVVHRAGKVIAKWKIDARGKLQ